MDSHIKYLGCNFKWNGSSIAEGFDCINLCKALAKDRGVEIPNINHSMFNLDNYHVLFAQRDDTAIWESVEPQADVLVVFKVNGEVRHVGYMINKLQFVHIMEKSKVTVEKITSPQWERRIVGFYKYKQTK